jgi:hypothetical protein
MKKKLACGNCDGGLEWSDGNTLVCPKCQIRVAGPFTRADEIPDYKVFKRRRGHRKRPPAKPNYALDASHCQTLIIQIEDGEREESYRGELIDLRAKLRRAHEELDRSR